MRSDVVTIEPEVVELGREGTQSLKVVNNTASPISNLFFCLYNTQKFAFSPDSFSLAPHEHRLVTVTLRLRAARSAAREFAYLKAADVNRRITLLVNGFTSPEPRVRPQEGIEDANTLSSREYHEVQTEAIERIIRQKEAYIELLEKERQVNFRTQESAEKGGIRRELEQMELRLILAENQKQSALRENLVLQEKFEEYRRYCEGDLKNYERTRAQLVQQASQVAKLQQQISFLQGQGDQYIRKLQEKEARIRELDLQARKTLQEHKREAEKRVSMLESRIEEQARTIIDTSRQSEDRIRELERRLEGSEKTKSRLSQLERQIRKRQEELQRKEEEARALVQGERSSARELQGERKRLARLQSLAENLGEKNTQLTSRVRELEQVNLNLREEVLVYRSKAAEQDLSSDKLTQYFDTALQSCKSENQALKHIRKELEKELEEHVRANRQVQDHNRALTDQISKLRQQNALLTDIKEGMDRKFDDLKQQNHLALMALKTENVELLERLSSGEATRREGRISQLESRLRSAQEELVSRAREAEQLLAERQEQSRRSEALQEENAKLAEKVRRYKKEARKGLRSINETAVSHINQTNEENRQLAAQVAQLQAVIANYDCQRLQKEKNELKELREQERTKSAGKSLHGKSGEKKGFEESHVRKERTSSRIIGIKDQRKQIHESHKAYSQTSNQDNIFSQLGELRELDNFLRNEEDRLGRLLGLQEEGETGDERAVFRAIRFFKRLEGRVRELKGESQLSSVKEVEFLKGRIRELESLKEQSANLSNVSLSKTREQLAELLEFVREQMRNQYKKLNDHIKLAEHKHQLLKRKIYEEYRARIIQSLGKKDKQGIQQLQLTLQRFIDAMSNLSHKQAVLQKEVKLKQHARKQNVELKQKVTSLNHLLQTKKGPCTRDPLKVLFSTAEQDWQDSLKREAELLTLSAEYQRLREQFQLQGEEMAEVKQQMGRWEKEADERAAEVLKLKRYQIQLQTNYQNQMQKQHEIIQDNKKRILEFTRTGKDTKPSKEREREYAALKESADKQKDVIRVLRQKEKMLQEILEESHRAEEKERRRTNEESRVADSLRDLKQANRQLRADNTKLKEKTSKLQEQLEKKNVYLKNLKGDIEENRIRLQRKDEGELERIREESKRIADELKRVKDQLDKARKRRQKEAAEHKNQLDRLANEHLINVKSLQSIVRALMDNLRDIYGRLRYFAKKRKGVELEDRHDLFDTSRTVNIDGLKISEAFEKVLAVIEIE